MWVQANGICRVSRANLHINWQCSSSGLLALFDGQCDVWRQWTRATGPHQTAVVGRCSTCPFITCMHTHYLPVQDTLVWHARAAFALTLHFWHCSTSLETILSVQNTTHWCRFIIATMPIDHCHFLSDLITPLWQLEHLHLLIWINVSFMKTIISSQRARVTNWPATQHLINSRASFLCSFHRHS